MSLGTPVNWSAPTASPAAQPEAFRYQGESYVRMGNGQILQSDNYLAQQSALNNQARSAAAANYDPNEPTRLAARAMESQPYRSPTTNQPVSRDQFLREHSRLNYQASAQYDKAMSARLANVATAWDTPLPKGVTVEMLPTGNGAFTPAPTAGALAPTRRGAPVGEALRQPVNLGVKPRAQPLLNQPMVGQAAGGAALAGGFAAYSAYSGGAGFFEGAGAGVGGIVGGGLGGIGGGLAGGAALGGAGTFAFPVVGTVTGAGVGSYIGGGIGLGIGSSLGSGLGSKLGRAIDNLIPDFFDDPNDLDPAAMDGGAVVTPGTPPPFTGGQGYGVAYTMTFTAGDATGTRQTATVEISGKILGTDVRQNPAQGTQTAGVLRQLTAGGEISFVALISSYADQDSSPSISNVHRSDGQPDTAGDPPGAIDPIRAPNPARQTAPAATPRTLPPPLPQPSPAEQPWPATPARETPDTTPLSPPAPTPNFNPTPIDDPVTTPTPDTTQAPTDLDSPSETPTNLADNPQTPPVEDPTNPIGEPTKIVWPGLSGLSMGGQSVSPLAVAIPVVLLDGLRQKINTPSTNLIDRTQPNPNVQITKPPPPPTVNLPQPPTCIYERQRVIDIQNKATDVQEKASNPVSGFPGLYGIGIESRLKLGQTFTLVQNVQAFAAKAWESTRLQKVLDVLTFIGVMHNVSMLSRNVGTTFLELVGQGIQAVGIRDEEDQVIDVPTVVNKSVTSLLKSVLGEEVYDGINENWNKASRIISSASMVIWTVRSIADSSNDLLEWIGQNTGKIGNALIRWGVVGEKAYPWMSENAKAQSKHRTRFSKFTNAVENVDDRISIYTQATSGVIEVTEEINELGENWGNFRSSVEEGIPDPWADNTPVKAAFDDAKVESQPPDINPTEAQKG